MSDLKKHWRWQIGRVLIPLGILAGLCVLVHQRWPADGFFMNLAAGFVGSIVSLGYIDYLIRRQESSRWAGADKVIEGRLRTYATAVASTIRSAFSIPPDAILSSQPDASNVADCQRQVVQWAVATIRPSAREHVRRMKPDNWRSLTNNVSDLWRRADDLLGAFGPRLSPEQLELLVSLQDHLARINVFYATFPEFAGTETHLLPKTKTPPEELQRSWYIITADAIGDLLDCGLKLFEVSARTSNAEGARK